MKSLKTRILCVLAVVMLAAFGGCSMEDGKVNHSASPISSATAKAPTQSPTSSVSPSASILPSPSVMPGTSDKKGNLGEDIGQGIQDIGEDIKNASGAAKQVNG